MPVTSKSYDSSQLTAAVAILLGTNFGDEAELEFRRSWLAIRRFFGLRGFSGSRALGHGDFRD